MTPEEHFIYCKERIRMYTEMMKRVYGDKKKEK